jgi:hypothetical protein
VAPKATGRQGGSKQDVAGKPAAEAVRRKAGLIGSRSRERV